ncbi:Piwi domain-containing protein, partial [Lentinula novae-zelandiae]
LPKRIVFFRDGVSEGTFESLFNVFIIAEGVRVVMRENGINHEMPKLTYIIVGKRYHITFYPESGTEANDGRGNCIAGFVNNTDDFSDPATDHFYLQSHSAIQGREPYSCNVCGLADSKPLLCWRIQDVAFTLCHVYAKATRSVSIPAPL